MNLLLAETGWAHHFMPPRIILPSTTRRAALHSAGNVPPPMYLGTDITSTRNHLLPSALVAMSRNQASRRRRTVSTVSPIASPSTARPNRGVHARASAEPQPARSSSRAWPFFRAKSSSNPRRGTQPTPKPPGIQKRSFFGLGEIVQVVTNPAATVKSLNEARQLLDDARRDLTENRERAQLRPSHTFSPLPGFFPRAAELQAVERALGEEPCFTVLFGASSVGKTALLRQALCSDKYHVLHFDLRIAGFADLDSLYMSLSQQMEQYFAAIAKIDGYGEFEKEAWGFKHDRLSVERRIADNTGMAQIRTSDIARLMELFQSSLLTYRQFVPSPSNSQSSSTASRESISSQANQSKPRRFRWPWQSKSSPDRRPNANGSPQDRAQSAEKDVPKPVKKMPVFFIDEAHKLPGLIQSMETMKCLLDSMLVLTKQDRLCHVIHSTSDPFYQTWLRQLNVMQHCKIITIGDCSKSDARTFYHERIVPRVPERLRHSLSFERLYEAFGGRLVHWQDYITDYVNANGQLEIHQSSHFIQAHALLNLHIIHSSQNLPADDANKPASTRGSAVAPPAPATSPTHGSAGFPIYSPLTGPPRNPRDSALEPGYTTDFTAIQLLRVMSRLTQPGVRALPYFMLCREFGVRAVDGMVRGRILDLRWMEPVTKEGVEIVGTGTPRQRHDVVSGVPSRRSLGIHLGASNSGTAIMSDAGDDDMVPLTEREVALAMDDEEIFGPKVTPATPIMRYAMREVVAEYEDTRSNSDYASVVDMNDVNEY